MTISKDQSAPLVVVIGSTGAQGGSVIQELIKSDRPYRIRGLTRDPSKPAGKKLETQGVEVVKCDVNAGNAEGLVAAFAGAEIVFGVTNFWEHISMEKEINDGKAIADAAKKVGVKLFVWSSLPNVTEISGGKFSHVYHFDGKNLIAVYAKEIGLPIVEVQAGFYASNLVAFKMISKAPDGSLTIDIPGSPDTLHPVIDIAKDYGLFVRSAIETKGSAGKVIHSFSELISRKDMSAQFEEVTGKKLAQTSLSYPEYAAASEASGTPPQVAKEMMEMFHFFEDYGYYGLSDKDLEAEKKALNLPRPTTTFRGFAKSEDWSSLL